MLIMSEASLFDRLKEGDINTCYQYLDEASSGGEALVKYLNTLLYYAISINWENDIKDHPIILINSIKNMNLSYGSKNPNMRKLKIKRELAGFKFSKPRLVD